jgi:HAD superfamily hydrolase (TIGR01459 family)
MATATFCPPLLDAAGPLLSCYDVLFCDIWGVVHDGERALPASNTALQKFRAGGGTVILVSNAPAPVHGVAATLVQKGVTRDVYDAIVSSGEQALMHVREAGYQRVHQIGAKGRDSAFFADLALPDCAIETCEAIVCTGLENDLTEQAEHYRERLRPAAERQLPFVCANPDLVVHVGAQLLPCAGQIAQLYERMGGPVVWCGKPHASAYTLAYEKAAAIRGRPVPSERVLAIGDAVRTDLAGAQTAGADALFITSGIHRDEVQRGHDVDLLAVERLLADAGIGATAMMTYLTW